MGNYRESEILASASRTTSGEGALVATAAGGGEPGARFFLDVSIASAGDTLDVDLVAEVNGVDQVLGSFTQATGVGSESIVVDQCPANVKAVYAIAGTDPDYTFAVHCGRWE